MARGRSVEKMLTDLRKLQEDYIRKLPDKDLEALDAHFSGPYQMPNPNYGTRELSEELNRIIQDAPRLPEGMRVHRGTSRSRAVPDEGYPLTTTAEDDRALAYAESWLGMDEGDPALLLEVDVPKGSPGLSMSEELYESLFDNVMPFGDEMELILPRGSLERLKKYKTIEDMVGILENELRRFVPDKMRHGGLVGETMWQ